MRSSYRLALVVVAGLAAGSAHSAEFFGPSYGSGAVDPIYSSALFNFEGLYVGGTAGVSGFTGTTLGSVGVVVGTNFAINDAFVAGAEVQADLYFDGDGFTSFGAMGLGKLGGYISDSALLYGALGLGIVQGTGAYSFGGGAEFAMTDQLSLRGELLGVGSWGNSPSGAKASAGLLWHIP